MHLHPAFFILRRLVSTIRQIFSFKNLLLFPAPHCYNKYYLQKNFICKVVSHTLERKKVSACSLDSYDRFPFQLVFGHS